MLNDGIADGRDVSWIWDADFELLAGWVRRVVCAGTRVPEMAVRLYAGLAPGLTEADPAIERSLDRAVAGGGRSSRCRPTPRCSSFARCSLSVASPRSSGADAASDSDAIWQQVERGSYAADLALWDELAGEAAGPVLELGGSGRVALRLAVAGHTVAALDRSPALITELQRLADLAEVAIDARIADARDFDVGRRFAAILAPMQLAHLLAGPRSRRDARSGARPPRARRRVRGGASRRCRGALQLPLPDVLERDGWIFSSLPIEVRGLDGGLELRRLRQVVSPEGASPRSRGDPVHGPTCPASRRRRPRPGSRRASGSRSRPPPTTSARSPACWRYRDEAARARPLPGADEHLRRPRQHPVPPAPVRVAGIGFEHASAGPGESFDPAAHDVVYIGGGQDRDQRLVAEDMLRTKRDALAGAVEDGAVVLAVAATS